MIHVKVKVKNVYYPRGDLAVKKLSQVPFHFLCFIFPPVSPVILWQFCPFIASHVEPQYTIRFEASLDSDLVNLWLSKQDLPLLPSHKARAFQTIQLSFCLSLSLPFCWSFPYFSHTSVTLCLAPLILFFFKIIFFPLSNFWHVYCPFTISSLPLLGEFYLLPAAAPLASNSRVLGSSSKQTVVLESVVRLCLVPRQFHLLRQLNWRNFVCNCVSEGLQGIIKCHCLLTPTHLLRYILINTRSQKPFLRTNNGTQTF